MSFCINESGSVLIAGNGPSLAQIDYDRLPADFDVFRCNQFYLEEQYFVGKKIKAVFFHQFLFFEQQATMSCLADNKEYEYEHIVYSDLESQLHKLQLSKDLHEWFPDTIKALTLCRDKLPELTKYTQKLAFFENRVVTSGVVMALTAVAMGYKSIYVAGLDLYATAQTYAFDSRKNNLIQLAPAFKNKQSVNSWHSAETDLLVLKLLQELYGVQIYVVSPASPLSEHFALAPNTGLGEVNRANLYFNKSAGHLNDLVIPNSSFYQTFRQQYYPEDTKYVALKHNLIYRLLYDFLHLPSHIKKYIRQKKLNKISNISGGG